MIVGVIAFGFLGRPLAVGAEQISRGMLMEGTPCATRYLVKEGNSSGPTICVVGGVHGNEIAGYLAADQLATWKITKGTLVLVPRAHQMAIERNERAYPGNMNAMFPGDPQGSLMQRLAHSIWTLIKTNSPALLITLHESIGFHRYEPERYGQTLTYDFEDLTPLMERVIDRVNRDIPTE